MAEAAHKTSLSTDDEASRHPLARAMVWKRILLWSSMIMMLAGAALFATMML